MPQQNYLDELTPAFTPLLAIKEASRCLLCHDAPCSQACPAQTDPGTLFAQSTFVILKALPRQFAKIMPSVPFVPECARRRNYAKAVVPVPVLMLPLISAAYSVLLLILNNKPGWKFISPVLKRSAKSRLLAQVLPDCRPV